jgi:hypothetical protein
MFSQSFSSQLCKTHLWCQLLMEVSPDKVDEEHLLVHVTAGGAAGALASAVTTPLDVVKTRLQCQVHRPGRSYPKDFRGQFLGWKLSLSNFSSSEQPSGEGRTARALSQAYQSWRKKCTKREISMPDRTARSGKLQSSLSKEFVLRVGECQAWLFFKWLQVVIVLQFSSRTKSLTEWKIWDREREGEREIFFNSVKLEQCEALKEPCLWLRAPPGSKWLLDACVFSFILYLLLDWMEGLKGFWTLVREWQGVSGAQRFMSCSVVDAVRRIVAEEGLSALLRGLRPRVLFHTPAAAICWSTYEAGKSFFSDCA